MKLDYTGWVRRIDFNFRAKYPYISTVIYKISGYKYLIYVNNYFGDLNIINKEFDNSIRFITTPVYLTNILPSKYDSIIDNISDDSIPSDYEGLPLTLFDLQNLIECRNKGIIVSGISENHTDKVIKIILFGKVEENVKNTIAEQLIRLKGLYDFEVEDGGELKQEIKPSNDVFLIPSSASFKKMNLPFLERDESLWFDNIDDIYQGKFTKDNLYFYNSSESSCFIDFSIFENINIRNHLLLYDVIYCTLPLHDKMKDFLNSQKITKDDLLKLIIRGRIKIVNTQPESRLDYNFLKEIYNQNENSIISRRALAALCAIDIVSINNNYIFNDPELLKFIVPFAKILANGNEDNIPKILKLIMWPISAMRSSFDQLHTASTKAISNYGVNNVILEGLEGYNRDFKEKIEFEFVMHSESIHIAHALNSTYFPFITRDSKYTDHPYTLLMGNLLNFYKCANFDHIKENIDNIIIKDSGNPSIDLISILESNEFISIQEFESEIGSKVLRNNLSSLFHELNTLNENERKLRIAEYNTLLEKHSSRKEKIKTAIDLGEDTVGIIVPFINTGKKIIKWSFKKLKRKFPIMKDISEYIEDKIKSSDTEKRNVSLLTKINRVARLKKYYD